MTVFFYTDTQIPGILIIKQITKINKEIDGDEKSINMVINYYK